LDATSRSNTGAIAFYSSVLWPAGHRMENTVRYLGIEIGDAIEIAGKST
jgi:hypothetical protein